MRARGGRLAGGLAFAALAAAVVPAASATAGTVETPTPALELSVDGVTFASAMPRTILDESYALVPGDRATGTVWVRNAGGGAGWIRVTVAGPAAGDPQYVGMLSLLVGEDEHRLSDVDACTEVVPPRRLRAGEVLAVPVAMTLPDVTGTTAQGKTAALSLRVTMADHPRPVPGVCAPPAASATDAGPAPGDAGPAATVHAALVPVALLLILAAGILGAAMRLAAERRAGRGRARA